MPHARVSIRRYKPSDRQIAVSLAPRLEIGVADWRKAEAVADAVSGWVTASLDDHGADDRAVLVAVANETVVGLVTVTERQHFSGEIDAYVGELAVDAAHERQGVGTLLMNAAEDWARDRGLRHLTLETGAANGPARAFYAGRGYREEDVRLTKPLVRSSPPGDRR